VLTVALGFAAQTSIGNLIAGIFLLVDRPFEVGDHVQIEGKHGHVESISLLSTHVRTFDNLLVRWPNEFVLRAMIINFARNPAWRIELPFRVAFGSDVERAREVVTRAAKRCRFTLLDPEPIVWGMRIEESGVALELRAWVDRADFLPARTELVMAIHDSLRDAGIEIPYPQLTVSRGERPIAQRPAAREPEFEPSAADAEPLDSQLADPDPR
jgi:small conductance mechanosensitive channel